VEGTGVWGRGDDSGGLKEGERGVSGVRRVDDDAVCKLGFGGGAWAPAQLLSCRGKWISRQREPKHSSPYIYLLKPQYAA